MKKTIIKWLGLSTATISQQQMDAVMNMVVGLQMNMKSLDMEVFNIRKDVTLLRDAIAKLILKTDATKTTKRKKISVRKVRK